MDTKTWAKVKDIFSEIVDLDAAERLQKLDEICNGDHELRSEVEALLLSNDEVENFIEEPAFTVADAMPADAEPTADRSIGHYRIVREIGRGGMGTVFLATRDDGEFQQEVAIKVVSSAFLGSESVRRFRQERQILAELNHPNIARLLDGGVTDDALPYLVMEHVDGEALIEHANEHNLSVESRLRLFLRVCDAVAYAHRNLIVHRDIKPSNILVTTDGEPKLLDFGLAKILDIESDDIRTATNFRALTPAYASPEQIRGDQITTASDIYSLGVVLYELLTGSRPFNYESMTFEKMIELASGSEPILPSQALSRSGRGKREKGRNGEKTAVSSSPHLLFSSSQLKGDIDNIVLMAMRHESERRYRSVEQFATDIDRHLNALPITAAEDTFAYRSSKFVKRHRIGVASAVSIVLILIAGIVTTTWQAGAARRQRDVAQQEKAKAERINQFLQEMLSYSNQSWTSSANASKSRDVTINEMLDEIAPQIETELADQPEVRAQMFRTIGSAYNSQARYDQAEKYLRLALEIQRQIYGDEHYEVLLTLSVLGETLFQTAKYDEAVELSTNLVSILRRKQRESAPNEVTAHRLAGALHLLGTLKFFKGDPESSIALLREALATASNLNLAGKERGLLAEIELNLGAVILAQGDLDESETLLRKSLAEFRALSGNPRWEMGVTLNKLGECLVYKKRFNEAEAFLLEAENIYRKTLGDSNTYLAKNLNNQGLAAFYQKNFKTSEEKAAQSLEILRQISPTPNPVHARALLTLGETLCKTKRAAQGKSFLRQSLDIYSQSLPEESKEIVEVKAVISQCQNRRD